MVLEVTSEKSRTKNRHWPPLQGEWTYEDYAQLPDNIRYEVIKGDLYMSPAPRPIHQETLSALHVHLWQHVREKGLGKLYFSPIDVNLPNFTSPVQPDLLFIANEHKEIIKTSTIEGVPDFIAEVLSPGNLEHDRGTKFHVYAQAGVQEYWIIDPQMCEVDVFVLRGHAFVQLGTFGREDKIRSELFADLQLAVTDICVN